jgi:hypothetical protein
MGTRCALFGYGTKVRTEIGDNPKKNLEMPGCTFLVGPASSSAREWPAFGGFLSNKMNVIESLDSWIGK